VVDAGKVSVDKAQHDDSGFTTLRSLFYHQNPVEGQPVSQLCVPPGSGINMVCRITVWLTWVIMVVVMCMPARSCVNGCAVKNMCDVEFDHVLTSAVDVLSCGLFSYLVDNNHWTHLESSQRQEQEQLRLLDKLQDRFAVSPDLCDTAVYRIQTISEFFPRQMRPYRVSDALKPDVDRQILELIHLGLIHASDNPFVSPMMCMSPMDGG